MFAKDKKTAKPKPNGRLTYRATGKIARPLSFLLKIAFFVLIGVAAVSLICMLIIAPMQDALANLTVAPYLHMETGTAGNSVYHVTLGGGVQLTVPADRVTPEAIKIALYAGLVKLCLACLIIAPICHFVAVLLENLANGRYGDKRNPDMVCFSALTLLCGSLIHSAVSGYFNYRLQTAFAAGTNLYRFVFAPDWFALFTGILLLLAGFVYGCENARLPAPPPLPLKTTEKKQEEKKD